MSIFKKNKKKTPIPEECMDCPIEIDQSICTGEMTIGFRDGVTKKLKYAELVHNQAEVEAYCNRYGRKVTNVKW